MRVVNRTAVTIAGAEPYWGWTRTRDADFNKGVLTVARTRAESAVFLLPEVHFEEDLQEWVEENFAWLFEFQLAAWTSDESQWPSTRDLKTFREWFRIELYGTVVDIADDEIEGEEL